MAWAVAWLALAASVALAPGLADGYTALQWTRHLAGLQERERPVERTRLAARWAARAVDRLAPLPHAAEAAFLALGMARQAQAGHPVAAREASAQVLAALERQRRSPWRGLGLAEPCAEAQRLAAGPGGQP